MLAWKNSSRVCLFSYSIPTYLLTVNCPKISTKLTHLSEHNRLIKPAGILFTNNILVFNSKLERSNCSSTTPIDIPIHSLLSCTEKCLATLYCLTFGNTYLGTPTHTHTHTPTHTLYQSHPK